MSIVKKYKTECNPLNKRLVNVDSKCDEEVKKKDKHAIGGYLCGDDGKWSNQCVIAYCEEGYHFDYQNQKCIEDLCYEYVKDMAAARVWLIVGICFGVLLFIIIVIVVIILLVCYCKKKKNTESNEPKYIALNQFQ